MSVDLHIHTPASDGTLTPTQIFDLAASLRLEAIAFTDHDNVDNLEAGNKLSLNYQGIEFVPGVEMSSDVNGHDIHILGYYINYHDNFFKKHLSDLKERRLSRAKEMINCLNSLGLTVTFDQVFKLAKGGIVSRAHIARALLANGDIATIEEAFERYIGRSCPCYVEKSIFSAEEVIRCIRQVGGVAVLAHPGTSDVDDRIEDFIKAGLQGIEAYHTDHTPQQTEKYLNLAESLKLIATGGSDCHGPNSPRGLVIGTVNAPKTCLEAIKKAR